VPNLVLLAREQEAGGGVRAHGERFQCAARKSIPILGQENRRLAGLRDSSGRIDGGHHLGHGQGSCAPDLNPEEYVWSYMKTNGVSKKPLKRKGP
jgi:hypothetical protein